MIRRTTDTVPLPICATAGDPGTGAEVVDQRVRSALAGAGERRVSVADLRTLICTARTEIIQAGADSAQRMELSHQLRKILEALEHERPDLAPVRDHWKRIRAHLGPAAGTSRVAQVTDMLIILCRTG